MSDTDAMMRKLSRAIQQSTYRYQRLVLLVGEHSSGKTRLLRRLSEREGYPYLRLGLELSAQILGMTSAQRGAAAAELVMQLVACAQAEVVVVDDIEILHLPGLHIEPLKALQQASRSTVVVAAWPGTFRDRKLTYAAPGHPEHRIYSEPGAIVLSINP
jgi:type II secretory pathway predicted ATPase ExeA